MSINNKLFKEMFKMSSAAAQHKAACRETRLDIQNYVCNGNLLCYHGVVEKNHISSLQSQYYYYYYYYY